MSREAMKQALDALGYVMSHGAQVQIAKDILTQAIEQAEKQEPVAWLKTWSDGSVSVLKTKSHAFADHELEPLYAAPPKREWVGLTDDELLDFSYRSQKIDASNSPWFDRWGFARAIEAKLKEKNA